MTPGVVHRQLVVMVKRPVAGQVKTRLARDIGVAQATSFYRHATSSVISRLARDSRWQTLVAITPDTAMGSSCLFHSVPCIAQGGGDLGARMGRIMERLPPGPVVIVGSDCLALSNTQIDRAYKVLGNHDAVVGPADDGGYWLIGLKRRLRCPNVFAHVRWSTPETYADTLHHMAKLRVGILETLRDVDTGADFERMHRLRGRRILPAVGLSGGP